MRGEVKRCVKIVAIRSHVRIFLPFFYGDIFVWVVSPFFPTGFSFDTQVRQAVGGATRMQPSRR